MRSTNAFHIRASYIGNPSDFITVDIKEDLNIGSIIIEECINQLDEVEVLNRFNSISQQQDNIATVQVDFSSPFGIAKPILESSIPS